MGVKRHATHFNNSGSEKYTRKKYTRKKNCEANGLSFRTWYKCLPRTSYSAARSCRRDLLIKKTGFVGIILKPHARASFCTLFRLKRRKNTENAKIFYKGGQIDRKTPKYFTQTTRFLPKRSKTPKHFTAVLTSRLYHSASQWC